MKAEQLIETAEQLANDYINGTFSDVFSAIESCCPADAVVLVLKAQEILGPTMSSTFAKLLLNHYS
jgi:hypothetical protein